MNREKSLERICAESYQVVGILADEAGRFNDPSVTKALDNLSQQKLVHRDVLPFASVGVVPPKDHEIAACVNELRDIAIEFHATQQLRERIAHVVVPLLKRAAKP